MSCCYQWKNQEHSHSRADGTGIPTSRSTVARGICSSHAANPSHGGWLTLVTGTGFTAFPASQRSWGDTSLFVFHSLQVQRSTRHLHVIGTPDPGTFTPLGCFGDWAGTFPVPDEQRLGSTHTSTTRPLQQIHRCWCAEVQPQQRCAGKDRRSFPT